MKASQKLNTLIITVFVMVAAACTPARVRETPKAARTSVPVPSPVRASAKAESPTSTTSPSPRLAAVHTSTSAPTATLIPSSTPTPTISDHPWWNDTVFYEIFVRSFYDSDQDGIGDFNGLIEKLDYLNDNNPTTSTDLGVTGIWLMPIHPSPSSHGYDVTDYYAINPDYGSMEDFRRMVTEVHRRGMRLIIDLPLNHTSNQHPWFVQSQDEGSPYRSWYVWSDTDPGFKGVWNQQVWYPFEDDYYYSFFWQGMPDLNYTNPVVTAEMENVTRFWLTEIGIDGFRLDAIGSLIEVGPVTVETDATHDWFANYYNFYKTLNPEAVTIGEVWREDAIVIPYVRNHEVDLAFEFDLAAALLASLNEANASRLVDTLRSSTTQFPEGQYGTFLTNHDMARVMTQLGGNLNMAKAAASLYFSLPGVPFIYYGEEIGLFGDAPDAMGRRPMQWSGEPYAGFSIVEPWMLPDAIYIANNVAVENGDPDSLLSHYRDLISLRNNHPALRTGELFLLSTSNPGLFACLRTTEDESVLVVVNLTASPLREHRLTLRTSTLPPGDYTPVSLLDEAQFSTLTVLENGRISNYIPLQEILPYATIMMRFESHGN